MFLLLENQKKVKTNKIKTAAFYSAAPTICTFVFFHEIGEQEQFLQVFIGFLGFTQLDEAAEGSPVIDFCFYFGNSLHTNLMSIEPVAGGVHLNC